MTVMQHMKFVAQTAHGKAEAVEVQFLDSLF